MKNLSRLLKSSPVLIALAFMLVICAFYTPWVYRILTGSLYNPRQYSSMIFFIIYNITCFLVLPLLINHFVFKEKLAQIGLKIPAKKSIFYIIAALLLILPVLSYLASLDQFKTYYAWGNIHTLKLIIYLGVFFPVYYVAEEFFFRGFLFFILWKKLKWHSFWISDVIFVFAHIGKPPLEMLFAIPVGIILNYVALKTKSIFPTILVHYIMGLVLVITVNYIY